MMGRSLMGLPGSELAVGEEKAAGEAGLHPSVD